MTAAHMEAWPEIQDCAPPDLRMLGLATTRAIAWAYRDPDRVAALTAWLTPTSL